MIKAVVMTRKDRKGHYGPIIDVLEFLSDECGSALNAAAVCIRESNRFQEAKRELEAKQASTDAA